MNQTSNQSGLAVIETVLILVVIGIIGFTGWYVWQSKQKSDEMLTPNQSSSQSSGKSKAATNDNGAKQTASEQSDSWLLFTSAKNEFSIRVPDGWKLEQYEDSPSLYTFSNDNLQIIPGQKAVITRVSAGKDGNGEGFGVSFVQSLAEMGIPAGVKSSFQTDQGYEVAVYRNVVSPGSSEGAGGLPDGGVSYTYLITKSATKNIYAWYGYSTGQTDHHVSVEAALKTLKLN